MLGGVFLAYIIPEIIFSYSSHIGTSFKPRAISMISGRFCMAAMVDLVGVSASNAVESSSFEDGITAPSLSFIAESLELGCFI